METNVSHNLCGFFYYRVLKKLKIYNPSTRQLVTLPDIDSYMMPSDSMVIAPKSRAHFYFGYDRVNDDYKVICSISAQIERSSEHWVFVLKPGGGSWKKVAPLPLVDFCNHVPVEGGLSFNEVIYYMARIDMYKYVVVSFDIRSEVFMRMIRVPHKNMLKIRRLSIIDYCGEVSVIDYTHLRDSGMVDLWVLEEAENEKWSRRTLVLQPSQLHLVKNIELEVKGTTQTGKVILKPIELNMISPCYILCYDLLSNDMRKIEIKVKPDQWFSKDTVYVVDLMFMDQSESVMYLET